MGINLAAGFGAGGAANALEDLIKQKLLEQIERRQADHGNRALDLQARGQDISAQGHRLTQRGQDLTHQRWSTEREDTQTSAAAAAQKEAESLAAMEAFEQTLPEHLRPSFHAAGHKQTFKPEDFESLDQQEKRALRIKRGESDITHNNAMALERERQSGALRLARTRAEQESAANNSLTPKETNEVVDTLQLIQRLRSDPARPVSTGPIQGRGVGAMQDLEGYTRFQSLHDNLVNRLQLAQAGKLKGQGQISNMEREMLMKAATALTRKLGDADYLTELGEVEAMLTRMVGGGPAAAVEYDWVDGKLVPKGAK